MLGVILNIGSNVSGINGINGRGRIFQDGTFEYLPIPEHRETISHVPTYRDLGFEHVKFPDVAVHLDPEFETWTYGHVERGFGDISSILKMKEDGAHSNLFFMSNLQSEKGWFPYIIGVFGDLEIYDCRTLSSKDVQNLRVNGFKNNAHLKRRDSRVDFLIKGTSGSGLLPKAFQLSENDNPLQLSKSLSDIISTPTGKNVETGKSWYRWTLLCTRPDLLLKKILSEQ
jgi:hypothetical protein